MIVIQHYILKNKPNTLCISLLISLFLYGGLGPLKVAYNNYYSHLPFLLFHNSYSYSSRFSSFGIKAIDLKMGKYCDRRAILKELQQMINEVSENVKTMKEELSTLRKNVENMFKQDLRPIDSMELKREN